MNYARPRPARRAKDNTRDALLSGKILHCWGLLSVVQLCDSGSGGSVSFFVQAKDEPSVFSPTPASLSSSSSTSSISGDAFFDSNGEGIRDFSTSVGISDATVSLFTCNDQLMVNATKTDFGGYYSFNELQRGQYYIGVTPPMWYALGDALRGETDETAEAQPYSGVDPVTGRTECFYLEEGEEKGVSFALRLDVSSHSGPTTSAPSDAPTNGMAASDSPTALSSKLASEIPSLEPSSHSLIKTAQNTSTAFEPEATQNVSTASKPLVHATSSLPARPSNSSNTTGLTSYEMYYAMVIAAKISGGLSLLGSSLVSRDIIKKIRTQLSTEFQPTTTYLVLSMSVADMGTSFWLHILGSWMVPSGDGFPLAAGNEATCQVQATIVTAFFAATTITSSMLALAYWLIICRSKPEKELQTWKWRALLFGYPWGFGVFWAAVNRTLITPFEALNTPMWNCFVMFGKPGTTAFKITTIGALIAGINTCLLLSACRLSLMRFAYLQGTSEINHERINQVTTQGVLYIAGFIVTYAPFLIMQTASFWPGDPPLSRGYYVLMSILLPSQGFINSFIYFRPKAIRVKNRDGLSMRQSWARVLRISVPLDISIPRDISVPSALTSFSSFHGSVRGGNSLVDDTMGQPANESDIALDRFLNGE